QLIGNFRHRKLLAVVAGVAGLVLILILLLEISVRIELSKEAAIDATAVPSASEQKMYVGYVLTLQPTNSSWLQSADPEAATGAVPFFGPQTFRQVSGADTSPALSYLPLRGTRDQLLLRKPLEVRNESKLRLMLYFSSVLLRALCADLCQCGWHHASDEKITRYQMSHRKLPSIV